MNNKRIITCALTGNWGQKSNNPQFLEKLGTAYNELGVKPEIEIFDAGMIDTAKHYLSTGILKAPAHFAFILGAASGMPATPENLCCLVRMLPEGSTNMSATSTSLCATDRPVCR